MILDGVIRAPEDVDVLVENFRDNFIRFIEGFSGLADEATSESNPEDLAENVVVKITDELEIDVSTSTWEVT